MSEYLREGAQGPEQYQAEQWQQEALVFPDTVAAAAPPAKEQVPPDAASQPPRRSQSGLAEAGRVFQFPGYPTGAAERAAQAKLHSALAAYHLSSQQLRELVALGGNLHEVLRTGEAPPEVVHLITALSALLAPKPREQIRSPADVAGLLMVEMGHLDQEELRSVLLDTKNRVQDIVTVYRGSVNTAMVRISEVYKDAVRRNSAALIVAHNHPSGDVTPSPEDILVTRQIVEAGNLLDIQCLDHIILASGKWASLRERGLGFS